MLTSLEALLPNLTLALQSTQQQRALCEQWPIDATGLVSVALEPRTHARAGTRDGARAVDRGRA